MIAFAVGASVKDDVAAGIPMNEVIKANLARGASIVDTVRQAMRAAPKRKRSVLAAALQISPSEAPRLVELAIANGVPAEEATLMGLRSSKDHAAEVMRIGISADESKAADILRSAIRAGVDPAQVVPLIDEFVVENIQLQQDKKADGTPQQRPLTAEEILSSLSDNERETGAMQQSDLPLLVLPPVNGGSDRLASPN
jgi:hypothetical protein